MSIRVLLSKLIEDDAVAKAMGVGDSFQGGRVIALAGEKCGGRASFTDVADLKVPLLTDNEREWCDQLALLMLSMPTRLQLLLKDNQVTVVDDPATALTGVLLSDAYKSAGVVLAKIPNMGHRVTSLT